MTNIEIYEMIDSIVDIEWEMFSTVNNQGGRAQCQSRPDTFGRMRRSQLFAWTPEILESYLIDLKRAKILKRNLCTEKYAYMMAFTVPEEYEKIKAMLPAISEKKLRQIQEIVKINILWEQNVDEKYAKIRAHGRPLTKNMDTPDFCSVETYMTGELKTYSEKTIQLLHDYTVQCQKEGRNLANEILENTVAEYGYVCAEELEKLL